MSGFMKLLRTPEAALDHEPDELAGLLMEYLHSLDFKERQGVMQTSHITSERMVPPCNKNYHVSRAVIEAWSWLIRDGLVVPRPAGSPDQYDFSRRGEALKTRFDVQEYRKRARFPKGLLHPTIAGKTWSLYLKGEYDTAVFQAFKEVEVAVRSAGDFTDSDYGVSLMRAAFRPATHGTAGPLTDPTEPPAEQESLMFLLTGAYGRFRNPTAHRHGVLNDPTEAFEMLVLASHLLRVVERRTPTEGT